MASSEKASHACGAASSMGLTVSYPHLKLGSRSAVPALKPTSCSVSMSSNLNIVCPVKMQPPPTLPSATLPGPNSMAMKLRKTHTATTYRRSTEPPTTIISKE